MRLPDQQHDHPLLSVPASIAEATWDGWQCLGQALHRHPCQPAADRRQLIVHILGWLAGNALLVSLLYLLYRFSRF